MKNNRRNKETSREDAQLYDKVTHIETTIIDKLSNLRKNSKNCLCSHFINLSDQLQCYESSINYYQKFWKLYLTTELCRHKIQRLSHEINEWQNEIMKIQDLFFKLQELRQQGNISKKKTRRKACDIQKQFQCQYSGCFKSYGTELALKLHSRQKHNQQYSLNQDII